MQDNKRLIKEIENAFDNVSPPKRITLHVAEAHDSYDYDHEKFSHLDFVGRWQDIPVEHLEKCQAALSYLDNVGMRYYLPAFMTWYLNKLSSGAAETDNTLYVLDSYSEDERMNNYFKDKFSLFSDEQLRVCSHFVKYCLEDKSETTDAEFAQEIYEKYWKKFDK